MGEVLLKPRVLSRNSSVRQGALKAVSRALDIRKRRRAQGGETCPNTTQQR